MPMSFAGSSSGGRPAGRSFGRPGGEADVRVEVGPVCGGGWGGVSGPCGGRAVDCYGARVYARPPTRLCTAVGLRAGGRNTLLQQGLVPAPG